MVVTRAVAATINLIMVQVCRMLAKKKWQVKELVQKVYERSYVGIISLASLVSWHDSEKEGKEESSHFSSKKS